MIGSLPMKAKVAGAFAAVCLPAAVTCWISARAVGRMEVIAASGSEAALRAALNSEGDITFFASIAAFSVSLILAAAFFRALTDPFAALLPQLEAAATGSLTEVTPFTAQRGCMGRMARAIETCWEARTAAEAEAVAQRRRADAAERRCEEARLATEQERRVVMASLAQGLAALSVAKRGLAAPARPAAPAEPVLVVDNVVQLMAPAPTEEPQHWEVQVADEDGAGLRGLLARLGGHRKLRA